MDELERKILDKTIDFVSSLKQKEREAQSIFIEAKVQLQEICRHETILEVFKHETWCRNSSYQRICVDCCLYYYTGDLSDHPFARGYLLKCKTVTQDEFDKIRFRW